MKDSKIMIIPGSIKLKFFKALSATDCIAVLKTILPKMYILFLKLLNFYQGLMTSYEVSNCQKYLGLAFHGIENAFHDTFNAFMFVNF